MEKFRRDRKKNDSKNINLNREMSKKHILSRREAFKQMCGEILVGFDEIRGHKHCALSGLETIEREKLEGLIPFISREFELSLERNWLIGKHRNSGEEKRIFELTPDKTTAFNLINGKNSVGDIVRVFSERMGWELEQSFAFVKEILLDLVNLEVCLFANPVDD